MYAIKKNRKLEIDSGIILHMSYKKKVETYQERL